MSRRSLSRENVKASRRTMSEMRPRRQLPNKLPKTVVELYEYTGIGVDVWVDMMTAMEGKMWCATSTQGSRFSLVLVWRQSR